MSAKHTPGPWEARESGSGTLSNVIIVDQREDIIATVAGPFRDNYDADLIAAAPDILEALEIVQRSLDGKDVDLPDLCRKVDAAIAKAKGEEAQP